MRVTPECDTINSFPICNRPDAQFSPSVVYNGENYLVTWTDRRFTGTYFWTTAARVTPQGAVLDTGICIGTQDAHSEFYPNTAFDGSRCLTVWYNSYFEPFGIFGRFVNSNAQPEDTVITIALAETYLYNYPKVEFGAGEYCIVWADKRPGENDYDIYGQLVSQNGQLINTQFVIAGGIVDQRRPDIVYDGNRFLVVWTQEDCIYGQKIDTNGQLIGSAFRISEYSTDVRDTPRCSAGPSNIMVVWSQLQGTFTDIYGNLDVQTGIGQAGVPIPVQEIHTTIHKGPLSDLVGHGCTVYNITGRQVPSDIRSAGIYFIKKNEIVTQKVILVK